MGSFDKPCNCYRCVFVYFVCVRVCASVCVTCWQSVLLDELHAQLKQALYLPQSLCITCNCLYAIICERVGELLLDGSSHFVL